MPVGSERQGDAGTGKQGQVRRLLLVACIDGRKWLCRSGWIRRTNSNKIFWFVNSVASQEERLYPSQHSMPKFVKSILCLLVLLSLTAGMLAQFIHPSHAEPTSPCTNIACADVIRTCGAHAVPCQDSDDDGADHHHHAAGCCHVGALGAVVLAANELLCPPIPRMADFCEHKDLPGESPVFPVDKPPLI